jgi:S1-C subfamily serine protease
MISEVAPGSVADGVGLRSGDIIVEVNGNKVEDIDSFVRSLPKAEGPVVLAVWRDGRVFYVSFRL